MRRTLRFSLIALPMVGLLSCGQPTVISTSHDRGLPVPVTPGNMVQFYRQLGLIVTPPPLSLVGRVSSYATRSPDTTLVLVSLSLPNRSLTFAREGDQYQSPYEVKLQVLRGTAQVASVNALEVVRVATFSEVTRSDESVIFQHFFRLVPGSYTLKLALRDIGGSRTTTQDAAITVPSLANGRMSSPVVLYQGTSRSNLDSVPRILPSPRSSAVFGRDSTISIFLEAYGVGQAFPLNYEIRNEQGSKVMGESLSLARHGELFSGIISVPISNVGLGIAEIAFESVALPDTVRLSFFISFGEDIPIMSLENMIEYLRFFASAARLQTLRDAPAAGRGESWAAFLRETDSSPETPVNENLQAYFARIQEANTQFAFDRNPGWLSDRGMVLVGLGEPVQVYEQTVTTSQIGQDNRIQVWDYPPQHLQLLFYNDAGHWRLTRQSENDFWTALGRKFVR